MKRCCRPHGHRALGVRCVAAAVAGAGARRPHHPRRRGVHPALPLGAPALDRLLDLYGFVSVVLHAAELAACTALLGGVVFWGLLLPSLRARLPAAEADRLQGIGRRAVLIGAVAALFAKLAGGGLGLPALAATLETPAAGVFGADFVLALSAALPCSRWRRSASSPCPAGRRGRAAAPRCSGPRWSWSRPPPPAATPSPAPKAGRCCWRRPRCTRPAPRSGSAGCRRCSPPCASGRKRRRSSVGATRVSPRPGSG